MDALSQPLTARAGHTSDQSRRKLCPLIGVALGALLLCCLTTSPPFLTPSRSTEAPATNLASKRPEKELVISIILTADPGGMVGLAEGDVVRAALEDVWEPAKEERLEIFCSGLTHGVLFGFPVVLVTTGIGHDHASVCMSYLLERYDLPSMGRRIREVFFIGTAGFSPRRGGILDPNDCSETQGGQQHDDGLVLLGDVSVSPFSLNWDCQKCVWDSVSADASLEEFLQYSSVCRKPDCTVHGQENLFGEFVCDFWSGETNLADEVLAAAETAKLPDAPDRLRALTERYWQAMDSGSGRSYRQFLPKSNRVIGYTVASEASSNTFWEGAPFDWLGREYTAQVTNRAFHVMAARDGVAPPANISASDTVCVSSMEASGWMSVLALRRYYMGSKVPYIPWVNLRGAADYTHQPIRRDSLGRWVNDDKWLKDQSDVTDLQTLGYRHAIYTSSELLLHVFRLRNRSLSNEPPSGAHDVTPSSS